MSPPPDKKVREFVASLRPIVFTILERLPREKNPAHEFSEGDLVEFACQLEKQFGNEELRQSVKSILKLAAGLGAEGLPIVAAQLFDLVEANEVVLALEKLNGAKASDRAENASLKGRKFMSFMGAPLVKDLKCPPRGTPQKQSVIGGIQTSLPPGGPPKTLNLQNVMLACSKA